ncbi:hypothetical protein H6A07_06430 [Olsenella uli]|uniref:DUF6414 family protein n=1 Tax=Olsenella uli TaxID=133926 RepID=UPI00195C0FAD|nr:hypothetical protein [Olsenella uli]MBM6676376.1 hypothetical protein [Olsenella uli]
MADKTNIDAELFLPYYINQPRLLDIYAILNGGYSEYEEIESLASSESKKARSGSINGKTGFRLFKVGADISGIDEDNAIGHDKSNIKIVQTATSMLDIVIGSLRSQGFITDIRDSSEGSFVITTITARINSIKSLMNEAKSLLELSKKMSGLGNGGRALDKTNNIKQIEQIVGVTKELFGSEEIVSDQEEYAIVGTINDEYLYQSSREDIVGRSLTCLAQVKQYYPQGTQLLKNTIFTRMKDQRSKEGMIEALRSLKDSNFDYQADVISEITGKPVYQLEIIALYQLASRFRKSD